MQAQYRAPALWPYRLAVRTSPSHGENPGSIPGRVTKEIYPFATNGYISLDSYILLVN